MITIAPAPQTAQSYTSDYASAGWSYTRNRTMLSIRASWEKDTYADQPSLDVTHSAVDLQFQRKLSSSLTAELLGRIAKIDYLNAQVAAGNGTNNYDNALVGGSLRWRHGRGLEVALRYEHNAWFASGPGNGYHENRAVLTVGYRPRQDAQPSSDSTRP